MRLAVFAAFLAAAAAAPAFAHTGAGPVSGFAAGFGHPLGGLDHLLAMLAVGAWAGQIGGRAMWLVPSAFVATMLAGGLLGLAGVGSAGTETVIVASVLVLGAVVAAALKPPLWIAMPLVGALALFHGLAHGAELPVAADTTQFVVGFVLATALLHAAGIGAALVAARLAPRFALRAAGAAQMIAGVFLVVGLI